MLAGLTSEEDLHEPLKQSIKKRLPWLIILLGLGLVVSSVVGMFETVVAQLTIVMCFQSLILDMAGNVGTQSLAVTIRVLMDEDLTARQKFELVFKEGLRWSYQRTDFSAYYHLYALAAISTFLRVHQYCFHSASHSVSVLHLCLQCLYQALWEHLYLCFSKKSISTRQLLQVRLSQQ